MNPNKTAEDEQHPSIADVNRRIQWLSLHLTPLPPLQPSPQLNMLTHAKSTNKLEVDKASLKSYMRGKNRETQEKIIEFFESRPDLQTLVGISMKEHKVVQEFVLGVYDEEANAAFNQNLSDFSTLKDPRSNYASQRYHAHQYTSGTLCDLTNQPRETKVRFVCSEPRAIISSITELSTCKYALTIQSPMLCKHPLFLEERPVWHTINCNALPKVYKDTITKVEDTHISMIMDSEDQSNNYDSSE